MEVDTCLETNPVKCTATLVHKTNDACEALIGETIVISLEKAGLTDDYYQSGSLTITGDVDWKTNKPSSATVVLP